MDRLPRFIEDEFLDYRGFIYRGHCAAKWFLESTLDRLLRSKGKLNDPDIRGEHLTTFKYATRGRRGAYPPKVETENEWWALGQHYGLATPLLDWTISPFVAAYFAFAQQQNEGDDYRAVWALERGTTEEISADITGKHKGSTRPPIVEFIRPMSDENSRLVSQGGLFTRGPDGVRLEEWMKENFPVGQRTIALAKIEIPNGDRELCLRLLIG